VRDKRLEPRHSSLDIRIVDCHGPAWHGGVGVFRLVRRGRKWIWYDLTHRELKGRFCCGPDLGKFMSKFTRLSSPARASWLTLLLMGEEVIDGDYVVVGDIERYPPVPRGVLKRKEK
jgi:hypothetical protein